MSKRDSFQTGGDIIYLPRPRWRRGGTGGGTSTIPGQLAGNIVGIGTLSGTLSNIPGANLSGTISGTGAISGTLSGGTGTFTPTYYLYGF